MMPFTNQRTAAVRNALLTVSETRAGSIAQDHFLPSASHPHGPFPTKGEKEQLAEETGLTVTQVGDWFINARARCWRPMIENINVKLGARGAALDHDGPLGR